MEIALTLEKEGVSQPLTFDYTRMVNAGYVGRNQEEVRRHIDELAEKGIPGPKETPVLFPVITRTLVTDDDIEVYSGETSGEVEYVLLVKDAETIYVGLGSDHTDRHLEETDIPRSKQICPNIISQKVWPLSEVEAHWDDLEIQSTVVSGEESTLYQKGPLELILDPKGLMEFVRSKIKGGLENMVIFSGTLGTLGGDFLYGNRFEAELLDPKTNRRLELGYNVQPLDYLETE
jgi:hypothetical protein